ncbi:FAD-dependent oxidoreductase [Pseudonocardia sp. D17]|uniref:FAD-dependent oxidoreductase n=1 Tax=Pseudonocardia sp. D17 TaxID=882661 RepID=UPI0030D1D9A1|nr:hypothetical protein PSD17_44470 [Pseudonocardia sp. D17]
MSSVLVVGAGVIGLTAAVTLAEAGHDVTVRADRPPLETTSVVAGALWGPSFQEPMADTHAWTVHSLGVFQELATDPASGVRLIPSLSVSAVPGFDEIPPQARIIPDLRAVDPAAVPAGFTSAARATRSGWGPRSSCTTTATVATASASPGVAPPASASWSRGVGRTG